MGKARAHYWRIKVQRFRREHDGTDTPMTPERSENFPDKQLHQITEAMREKEDCRQFPSSGTILVRKGAIGILDTLLVMMRDMSRKGTKK